MSNLIQAGEIQRYDNNIGALNFNYLDFTKTKGKNYECNIPPPSLSIWSESPKMCISKNLKKFNCQVKVIVTVFIPSIPSIIYDM